MTHPLPLHVTDADLDDLRDGILLVFVLLQRAVMARRRRT
jgi:hypothetical protein